MKLALTGGITSVSLLVFIQDTTSTTGAGLTGLVFNTASLTAYYARPGAAATSITLATQTVGGAFSSGGFVEVDATNMPGVYRFDIPDAALATGVTSVVAMLKGAANMAPLLLEIQLSPIPANMTQINGAATNGNNATLSLAQLNIVNSGGSAIVASSTGGNGHGITASGNGSGEGITATGGATGNGIQATGGATSGNGVSASAPSNGIGITATGTVAGIQGSAISDGPGIYGLGGISSGPGILASAYPALGNGAGVQATGVGANPGVLATGGAGGDGIRGVGTAAGDGIAGVGGNTDGSAGISGTSAATNGDGMQLAGAGAGLDLDATTTDNLQVEATVAAGTLNDIADAILRRDWTAVAAPAARSLLNAARAIRNRVRINAGTMTIYSEDDTTPIWTAPVTTDAAALPIVEIDPT